MGRWFTKEEYQRYKAGQNMLTPKRQRLPGFNVERTIGSDLLPHVSLQRRYGGPGGASARVYRKQIITAGESSGGTFGMGRHRLYTKYGRRNKTRVGSYGKLAWESKPYYPNKTKYK